MIAYKSIYCWNCSHLSCIHLPLCNPMSSLTLSPLRWGASQVSLFSWPVYIVLISSIGFICVYGAWARYDIWLLGLLLSRIAVVDWGLSDLFVQETVVPFTQTIEWRSCLFFSPVDGTLDSKRNWRNWGYTYLITVAQKKSHLLADSNSDCWIEIG